MTTPSGVLLAGGASRRFGRSKLIEPLSGEPLFHRPLHALLASCEEVVVVLAPGAPDLALPPGMARVRFVHDETAHEGPLAGTSVALADVGGEVAVVVGADMPGLRPELLSLMAKRLDVSWRQAVLLSDADGPRPLPAALRVRPALALAQKLLADGERRLRALVLGLEPEVLDEREWSTADPEGAWRQDIDMPEDLPEAER